MKTFTTLFFSLIATILFATIANAQVQPIPQPTRQRIVKTNITKDQLDNAVERAEGDMFIFLTQAKYMELGADELHLAVNACECSQHRIRLLVILSKRIYNDLKVYQNSQQDARISLSLLRNAIEEWAAAGGDQEILNTTSHKGDTIFKLIEGSVIKTSFDKDLEKANQILLNDLSKPKPLNHVLLNVRNYDM